MPHIVTHASPQETKVSFITLGSGTHSLQWGEGGTHMWASCMTVCPSTSGFHVFYKIFADDINQTFYDAKYSANLPVSINSPS